MADTIGMADIRELDIDKVVKGFALVEYAFKGDCLVSSTSADHVRWYQETAADLTATSPSRVANVSPLASFTNLEVSWTRNTSYMKKYTAECTIPMEDMKSADIDVVARTLLRLTRAVVKQVDSDIWDVMTESRSVTNIQSVTSTAAWDASSGQNIIEDLMECKEKLLDYNYNPEGASLWLNQHDYKSLVTWLISDKGSSIPNFASDKIKSGTVMQLLGFNVKVNPNVTTDYALVVIPQTACTWKSNEAIHSKSIEDFGIGTTYRVLEVGVAYLTDPKACVLITNTKN